jgi:hypothetical protein
MAYQHQHQHRTFAFMIEFFLTVQETCTLAALLQDGQKPLSTIKRFDFPLELDATIDTTAIEVTPVPDTD